MERVIIVPLVVKLTTIKLFRIASGVNKRLIRPYCESITLPRYHPNINALKIRRLSIFSIPFNSLKINVYLGRIERIRVQLCKSYYYRNVRISMERPGSMIVGDHSPDGAAFPFSIHLQTNCRLYLLDDIIAGRRLNGLTLMQNEKLRGRACRLLLPYVMLLSARV